MTTGNIYTQVFDPITSTYQELQSDISPIKIIARSGEIGSKVLPYTGVSIEVFDTKAILMYPINIGYLNYNSGDGITIGASNAIFNTSPTGFFSALPAPISLGEANLISGVQSINIGNYNAKYNTWYSFSLGEYNKEADTAQVYSIGRANMASGLLWAKILGSYNYFQKSTSLPQSGVDVHHVMVLGDSNLLRSGVRYVNVLGNSNYLRSEANSIGVVGDLNLIYKMSGQYNLILGKSNTVGNGINLYTLGSNNSVLLSNDSYVLGRNNAYSSGNDNFVFGKFNESISGYENNVIGNSNSSNGYSSNIYGNRNATYLNSFSNILLGNDNEIFSGSNNNLTLGARNADQGSNGSITLGNDNSISGNTSSYIIGENNEYINNNNAYILGNENYAENSSNCFVLGTENSVSGFQNYVVGNNNIIRSGDYNSILIGISHQPDTGDFNYKVASVNLASVDNLLQVTPTDIKLVSINRPTINDENIIITSDLDSYLNLSNGLSNSGDVVNNTGDNTFNDKSYVGYPNQIKIRPFQISGQERWNCGPFSGVWEYEPYFNFTTGFFVKRKTSFYSNGYSITGDYYYISNDGAYNALFTFDLDPAGTWIITSTNPTTNPPLFYNTSTNSGVLPLNWTTMTSTDPLNPNGDFAYGYDPAPIFEYSAPTFNITNEEKINPGTSSFDYFYLYGEKSYTSADQGFSIIYGAHKNPQFDPAWLIIDNYSSGLYAINNSSDFTTLPQSGWQGTGFMGYRGQGSGEWYGGAYIPMEQPNSNNNYYDPSIKISANRTGLLSSSDPVLGKIYIPFIY
jgi:hypothetical protein